MELILIGKWAFSAILASLIALTPVARAEDEPEPDWKNFDWDRDPTAPPVVEAMLKLAGVGKSDILYDLGSGDGRIAITAARRYGIKTVGIEFNKELVPLSRKNAEKAGVSDKATFIEGDVFEKDFGEATVISIALWESINVRLRPRLLAMPAGTRIVSNEHEMGEWKPDRSLFVESRTSWGPRPIHLWIVPASVQGAWRLSWIGQDASLDITQTFQKFSGRARIGGREGAVRNGLINGRAVSFDLIQEGKSTRLQGEAQDPSLLIGKGWRAER